MLVIRMQRTGRKGFATYRIVVQDVRQTPSSGRVVAQLGHYNPHTKDLKLDAEKSKFYLANGAQPSDRVVVLFKKEGVKIPAWVEKPDTKKKASVKNLEKLRKNRPAESPAPEKVEEPDNAEKEAKEETEVAKETAEEPTESAAQEEVSESEPVAKTDEPVKE